MDNDDKPVGRILSRREVLALFGGAAGAAVLAACTPSAATPTPNAEAQTAVAVATDPVVAAATEVEVATVIAANTAVPAGTCVVIPELTEGPYFVDVLLDRADIRTDSATGEAKTGTPLSFVFNVSQVSNGVCTPLEGATVDVWHCDAEGVYSAVEDPGFDTSSADWLRGYQLTDASGVARFESIYPGWYAGRTVHVHFKIRTTGADGNAYEFTSQLFFNEAVTAAVYAAEPYAGKGVQDTTNATDGIYQDETLLTPIPNDDGSYTATLNIALDLSDTAVGADDSAGGGGPGGGGPGGGGPGGPP